jgi:hypothetical protein
MQSVRRAYLTPVLQHFRLTIVSDAIKIILPHRKVAEGLAVKGKASINNPNTADHQAGYSKKSSRLIPYFGPSLLGGKSSAAGGVVVCSPALEACFFKEVDQQQPLLPR